MSDEPLRLRFAGILPLVFFILAVYQVFESWVEMAPVIVGCLISYVMGFIDSAHKEPKAVWHARLVTIGWGIAMGALVGTIMRSFAR